MNILAIDPGTTDSSYCLVQPDGRPLIFDKLPNAELLYELHNNVILQPADHAVIEMVASYGMPVGAEVFETCVWIGRFYEAITTWIREPELVKRHFVKVHHCHAGNASDSNIRQALVDRFAPGERNHGKGTKAQPGWFHGFHSDIWQAYALAVYTTDQLQETGAA